MGRRLLWFITTASVLAMVVPPALAVVPVPIAASALNAPPGAMAEATIAADAAHPGHLAAAADPYLDPVRIVVVLSDDAGATWSPPITVIPDGYAKSYDPALAFDNDGSVVVVGGASGQGAPHCQPASSIFVATVSGDQIGYDVIRDTRDDAAYVDRPGLAVKASGAVRTFVTWTESRGVAPECRATPLRSTIMLARLDAARKVLDVHALPPGGLGAPFGATMALSANGTLDVAVGDHGNGSGRLVVVTSSDEGATMSPPFVVDEGPDVPLTVPGIGGVVTPVPSIATGGGRVAVAWNKEGPSGTEAAVFDSGGGDEWHALGSPSPELPEILPTLTYDRTGHLWSLVGRPADGQVNYTLYRMDDAWGPGVSVGGGPSTGFPEIGEGFGLVSTGDQVVAAVPIDGPTGSSLSIAGVATAGPTDSTLDPPPSAPRPAAAPNAGRAPPRSRGLLVVGVGAVVLSVAAAAAAVTRVRRRR